MSEYQYFEFQAIDRPLTGEELAQVRSLSTRATITSTRFVNVYNFGSFRGDPLDLMKRYYDAFLYLANWGAHQLMLRLPRESLDAELARRYCVDDDTFCVHTTDERLILDFDASEAEGEYWDDEEADEGMLGLLANLRGDIAAGDRRALYLGWLLCVQAEIIDEDTVEPPVPAGLGDLSGPLQALAEFLSIGEDLLQAAAEGSGPAPGIVPPEGAARRWLDSLAESEKDELLLRVACGTAQTVQGELRRRIRESIAVDVAPAGKGRTVGELLESADRHREMREQQKARERERRRQEQVAARAAYLESIAGKTAQLWDRVATLVAGRIPTQYDEAVTILTDLRDVAAAEQDNEDFRMRLAQLRANHARKPSFISKLDGAGLTGRS